MTYVCTTCHYIFSAEGQPDQCPDCGKYTVQIASDEEMREFKCRSTRNDAEAPEKVIPVGCECCSGHVALFWKDEQNSAFIDSEGEIMATVHGKAVQFRVNCCPNCGRKFVR